MNDAPSAARRGLARGESLWAATAPAFSGDAPLGGRIDTDVAIVGAGVAGLSTALHLRERGTEVLVLEAAYPGGAATGASGGILAPEFPRDGIARACRLHGRERGERLARLVGRSAAYAFEMIERYRIDCDVQQQGFVSPGRTAREIEALRSDGDSWRALGFDVEFLDAPATEQAIGSRIYGGALHFAAGGALNPLAYAVGLAEAATRLGVPIGVGNEIRSVRREGRKWQLRTKDALITANRVVLAANGGNAALHPKLAGTTLPLLVHEYASPPLPYDRRRKHFGAGLPYTDRQAYIFSARFDGEGRMISAIPEVIPKWTARGLKREAVRRVRHTYSMDLPSVQYAWSGTAYLNPTLLPSICLPEGDASLVAIQACNGRGLAVNTIFGSEVAALLAGNDGESLSVPLTEPKPVPLHFLAAKLPRAVITLAQAKDRWRRQPGG